jgi:hypothetical protein
MNSRRAGFDPVREGVGRNQLPSELQHAFEEAIAKYSRWQSGDEPTVSYQMQDRSISSICTLMTFYENLPLRPVIMALLIAVADERHADLKNDLENNYARIPKGRAPEARSISLGLDSTLGRSLPT